MSTRNIHFYVKIGKNPKIPLNICLLELSEEFPRDSKTGSNYIYKRSRRVESKYWQLAASICTVNFTGACR